MIKLQDFAAQYKVTDRAIQKHLKKHEKELEGHFERKGPNGTWLDEYACDYIKEMMRIQTVVVSDDSELQKKIKQLETELEQLKGASALLKELYDVEHEKFLEISKDQALLEGKIELEVQKVKLQAERDQEQAVREAQDKLKLDLQTEFNLEKQTWEQELKKRPLKERWKLLFGK